MNKQTKKINSYMSTNNGLKGQKVFRYKNEKPAEVVSSTSAFLYIRQEDGSIKAESINRFYINSDSIFFN